MSKPARPLASMTGFARADGAHGAFAWTFELKSVNGRGFDARCRLAAPFDALEAEITSRAAALFARGNVQISLTVKREAAAAQLRVNEAALALVTEEAQRLAERIGADAPRAEGLLALRGVLELEEAEPDDAEKEARNAVFLQSFEMAAQSLAAARSSEGERLKPLLAAQLDEIERLTEAAASSAAAQPEALRDRLKAQLDDLLDGAGVPEDRLAAEAAILAVKADIREETDRLTAHVASARELIAEGGPVGRKLDFLAQEFNREANTVCSKVGDVALKRIGLDLKAVIDQLREQVQNIE